VKSTKFLVIAVVVSSSFPVLAQQADATVQQSASASAAGTSVNQSANVNASANANAAAEMRPVGGELVGKLDSKTAKVGDEVVVKTTQNARCADGTVISKGSRLVGHVTEVRAHAKGSEDSMLAVQFDRAELKSGQSMAIHSVIETVSPSATEVAMSSSSMESQDSLGLGSGGGMRSSGGARSGGGLGGGALTGGSSLAGSAGGVAGSTAGSLGTTANAAGSGLGSAGNGALGAASHASGSVSAATAGGLQSAASGSGALAAHATGISGLMLAGDASGNSSGMLSASRKNVHLDSGTQFVLGVSSAVAR
jgi:hypothetical protein